MERGFILHPFAQVERGRLIVKLHGVLASGEAFAVLDDRFRPYAFVRQTDLPKLGEALQRTAAESPLRSLSGEGLVRLEASTPESFATLRRDVESAGCELLEGDLRIPYRYLMDHGIRSTIELRGESVRDPHGVRCFSNPAIGPADYEPKLRVLSLDIETTPDASRVVACALVGPAVAEVHLVSEGRVAGAVSHPDEGALLRGVVQRIRALDPDVLTGWNVIDFDLRVLARRCQACGVRFALGRGPATVRFERDSSFSRQSRASVLGRQVLDAMGLVRDAGIPLDDFRLETAARTLLGRGKQIDAQVQNRAAEIDRMYRHDPAALVAYNREDAKLVLDILERETLIELAVERSRLTGMQLDRVGASIASFDLLYLPALHARGFAAPTVKRDAAHEPLAGPIRGGAVLDSTPGLFRNVAVFDFRSLYPSLIRTFNLDPWTHARAGQVTDPLCAPNGARFSREPGILPELLATFAGRRRAARERGWARADLALKIHMNACFGVLAARTCRFFDRDLANAITTFGQQTLAWTREAIEAEGVRVLYGDTDSVFVALDPRLDATGASRAAEQLRTRAQERITARVRETYRVEPVLDLQLARIYARFFQPRLRGGTQGSKKRYAGMLDGQVEVVGLEAIRRDWPHVVRRLQLGMLQRWFTDRPVLPFVREIVESVRAGACDRELAVRKGLRKGSVERYGSRTPPHVEAARRAGAFAGGVVTYVMTKGGPEPVLEGRSWPTAIDYDYYVERMLRPVAEAILSHLGQSFDEALGRPRQLRLW